MSSFYALSFYVGILHESPRYEFSSWRFCGKNRCNCNATNSPGKLQRQHFYRPQTKFAKVMFSQVSVHVGCLPLVPGVSAPPWADTPSPGQTPPPPGQTPPPRRTPPWADILLPSACWHTPPAQCMLGYTPPAQCMLRYGQQADGTHPTGMYSCYTYEIRFKSIDGLRTLVEHTVLHTS